MNQDQRKFLIQQVEKTYKNQYDNIEQEIPIKPSLNNYLVSACLDGSLVLHSSESISEKIKERVLSFGANDLLILEENNYNYRTRRSNYKSEVTLAASDLFVFPQAYVDAVATYEAKKKEVEKRLSDLTAQKDTIILKIQIGSNQVLDKLITQVDNMADLSIMNSQLLLT